MSGSVLNLDGISGLFSSPAPKEKKSPTAQDVTNGSYNNLESRAFLKCGRSLYVVFEGGKKLKLTLVDDNDVGWTGGIKLSAVDIVAVKKAVECGALLVDGKTFEFESVRALKRMLAKLSKNNK
ncbi:MAG: hypothetical protein A2747_01615 [Candidatus Yonathbacteria bacterium RIFCSPHIGHO2_01_FULL_44_41]|uniref:Uncharacterized protein n=1 Tax=Candidatus Yonathbacteria bacterium RIFCSPHIGHO2_02_FULL_44_14 TaxID=1802724 RepID=A0A1G2SB12_9BACT|nr:MAG: hypothetical protein A2747_01615 [Candidatus Yonathbacteria bacterium RIFCSPHIGHO2_01_FULL_44_41]OHA81561.1 MAG: hypothetical protein A3D51_02190 [Candidatus Yonathbacteria bacterium RIFCSPHIGHO2_02_FULL_44_14]OHA81742.1 MAG: hypothetical protein A3B06_02125 [Candidatus Yonathbacteria bacterium RIFCSPLOWO2_01_FULL_43_20]